MRRLVRVHVRSIILISTPAQNAFANTDFAVCFHFVDVDAHHIHGCKGERQVKQIIQNRLKYEVARPCPTDIHKRRALQLGSSLAKSKWVRIRQLKFKFV